MNVRKVAGTLEPSESDRSDLATPPCPSPHEQQVYGGKRGFEYIGKEQRSIFSFQDGVGLGTVSVGLEIGCCQSRPVFPDSHLKFQPQSAIHGLMQETMGKHDRSIISGATQNKLHMQIPSVFISIKTERFN